ncbi:MAG: hypothetical protein FD126_3000, partial [Elusimicrobia bacterium]
RGGRRDWADRFGRRGGTALGDGRGRRQQGGQKARREAQ